MKTKEQKQKTLVQQLREIRDAVSGDIQNMSFEQLKAYLKNKKPLHPTMFKSNDG